MKQIKVMAIFGTRPEEIKMGPVVRRLIEDDRFSPVVVSTGQHAEMLQQVLDVFHIRPDYDLKIMKPGQGLTQITMTTMPALGAHRTKGAASNHACPRGHQFRLCRRTDGLL